MHWLFTLKSSWSCLLVLCIYTTSTDVYVAQHCNMFTISLNIDYDILVNGGDWIQQCVITIQCHNMAMFLHGMLFYEDSAVILVHVQSRM